MKHMTLPRFWRCYEQLPKAIQMLADKNFQLLKTDPFHPSPHFKKIGQAQKRLVKRNNCGLSALAVVIERWVVKKQRASFGFGSELTPNMISCFRHRATNEQSTQ